MLPAAIRNYRCLYNLPSITKPHSKVLLYTAAVRCRCMRVNLCLDQSVRSSGMMIWKPDGSMPICFPLNCVSLSFILQYVIKTWSSYISGDLARLWWIFARLLPGRPGFTSRSVHVGFMMDSVTTVQDLLWVHWFIPKSVTLPIPHNLSYIVYNV